jgi:hypothetical protein
MFWILLGSTLHIMSGAQKLRNDDVHGVCMNRDTDDESHVRRMVMAA